MTSRASHAARTSSCFWASMASFSSKRDSPSAVLSLSLALSEPAASIACRKEPTCGTPYAYALAERLLVPSGVAPSRGLRTYLLCTSRYQFTVQQHLPSHLGGGVSSTVRGPWARASRTRTCQTEVLLRKSAT